MRLGQREQNREHARSNDLNMNAFAALGSWLAVVALVITSHLHHEKGLTLVLAAAGVAVGVWSTLRMWLIGGQRIPHADETED